MKDFEVSTLLSLDQEISYVDEEISTVTNEVSI